VALLLGSVTAFANSTAFNGYVQSSGSTGVDLTTLDGGNFRVTVTSTGQLNFRYFIGDQTFDSNPEAATVTLIATSDSPGVYSATYSGGFNVNAIVAVQHPAPGASSVYTSAFHLLGSSEDPGQVLSDAPVAASAATSKDEPQIMFHSDTLSVSGALQGGAFDVTSLTSVPMQVPQNSFLAFVGGVLTYGSNSDPFPGSEEAPEPATSGLIAGALLGGCLLLRKRAA
jgi:hypothetical protein